MPMTGPQRSHKNQEKPQELPSSRSRRDPLMIILVSLASILCLAILGLFVIKYIGPSADKEKTETVFSFSATNRQASQSDDPQAHSSGSGESFTAHTSGPSEGVAEVSQTAEAGLEASSQASQQESAHTDKQVQADLIQAHIQPNFDPSQLISQTYCLLDLETGLVLAQEKADQAFAPASLTKVLTALLALDHYQDLNQRVVIQEQDVAGLAEAGASTAGFQPGQELTVEDLIHGLLLPSGADAAHALAREISGSQEAFVQAMNQKAQEIGLKHSHFTNPTGLPEDDLYSTAQDMAKLLWTACQDKRFVQIAGSNSYAMAPDAFYPEGLGMLSTFMWKFNSDPDFSTSILAGKSGYTGQEQCQASLFEKNGRCYILVTLGAATEDPNSASAVHDQVILMNELVK